MAATTVDAEVHLLNIRPGIWCDVGLLPSAVELDVVVALTMTLSVIGRFTSTLCNDCGAVGELRRRR